MKKEHLQKVIDAIISDLEMCKEVQEKKIAKAAIDMRQCLIRATGLNHPGLLTPEE